MALGKQQMIFLTSDTHFYHQNILGYTKRPWASLPEMHEGLIQNYNKEVGTEDEVYFIGDVMMGGKKDMPWRMEAIFNRLNGTKYLVKGNHDKNWEERWFSKHFVWVKDYYELRVNKSTTLILGHYPFLSWHGMGRGAINAHGHCHQNLDQVNLRTRRIDVGVDAMYSNFAPISVDRVLKIMEHRKSEFVDHHGRSETEEL